MLCEEWETALWQRRHTDKNLKNSRRFRSAAAQNLLESMERDIKERATMSIPSSANAQHHG